MTTTYSSGQDAVFLTAELISVPNEPVADLQLQLSGPTQLARNQISTLTYTVNNLGPNTASANTTLTISLPAGVNYQGASANGWSCIANTTVTCSYNPIIADDTNATPLDIQVIADASAANSVSLSATVTGIEFDNVLSNNTVIRNYSVVNPDFSTSTKRVTDINGGNVQPGDILRYEIEVSETNGIGTSQLTITDHLPANINSFNIVSAPAGANNLSQPAPAGNNNSGIIEFQNISIAANGSATLIFDAQLASSVAANTQIDNTAQISSPGAATVNAVAPSIYISQPANPAAGNKPLYLRQNNSLSRIQPTSIGFITLADNAQQQWDISPAFQSRFEFSANAVTSYLFLQNDFNNGSWGHTVNVTLLRNGVSLGNVSRTITVPSQGVNGDNVALFDFVIPIPVNTVLAAGDVLSLRVINDSEYAVDSLRVYSEDPNTNASDTVSPYSLVSLPAATVINVDQIEVSTNSNPITEAFANDNLNITASVSDPFGSFDIRQSRITITDSNNTVLANNQTMTLLSDSGNAEKTFSYDYSLPANAVIGDWNIEITADEGVENEISHTSNFILKVIEPLPSIVLNKTVAIDSDPVNGTNSPKALPGALLTYTISAQNSGPGIAANDSIIISDAVPANTTLFVGDLQAGSPIAFTNGSESSGLSFTFIDLSASSDDLSFSSDSGNSFSYTPTPDSDGFDEQVTHFRINPKGTFIAPTGSEPTQFSVQFRIRLN